MVDRDVTTSDGYSYTVTSAIADWTRDELRSRVRPRCPTTSRGRYTDLPSDFPQQAADEAEAITAEATTPYDKALALQTYLRSDRFTYDKTVAPGHSSQALLTFLFETRRGYCEQFASTFAALARSVGLPSRVAVGFTPGEQDIYDPTIFTVQGRARPRLARGVPRRVRLGPVRAHDLPGPAPGFRTGSASRSSRTPARAGPRSPTAGARARSGCGRARGRRGRREPAAGRRPRRELDPGWRRRRHRRRVVARRVRRATWPRPAGRGRPRLPGARAGGAGGPAGSAAAARQVSRRPRPARLAADDRPRRPTPASGSVRG